MTRQDISFPLRFRDRKGKARWSVGTATIDMPEAAPLAIEYVQTGGYHHKRIEHQYRVHDGKLFGEIRMGAEYFDRPVMAFDTAWPEEVRGDPMRWRDILLDGTRWRVDFRFAQGRYDNDFRKYIPNPQPTDILLHPFNSAPGRGLSSRDDFIGYPADEPDYDENLARARRIVSDAMVFGGRVWNRSQGPVFSVMIRDGAEPYLGHIVVKPYFDVDFPNLLQQAMAFPATGQASIEQALARFERKPPKFWRDKPTIFLTDGYDTGILPKVGEAAALVVLWEARKILMGDADLPLLRAILALQAKMQERWPGHQFDLGAKQVASWAYPSSVGDIPDIAPVIPYVEDLAARLEGKIRGSVLSAVRLATERVRADPVPVEVMHVHGDDEDAFEDLGLGTATGP